MFLVLFWWVKIFNDGERKSLVTSNQNKSFLTKNYTFSKEALQAF